MLDWKQEFSLRDYSFKEFDTSILAPDLSVILSFRFLKEREDFLDGFESWVKITSIDEEQIEGVFEEPNDELALGTVINFKPQNILRIRGSIKWIRENLFVYASEKVLVEKERVGYFYNRLDDDPMSYGRVFYSESEKDKIKSDICLFKVTIKELLQIDPVIGRYLPRYAYKGYIRISDTKFKLLNRNHTLDQEIYPSPFEF